MTTAPDAIGRYQVFAEVGVGGFASVYRAYDPVLDREVALKVLHPHLTRDPQVGERFLREGRSLARLRHPNLVQVYDAGVVDGLPYLAMEFVPGQSLAERAAAGPISLAEVTAIVRQVAAALDAVHAAGLIHRDIKPANILLAPDGRAVLLDLGIAREADGAGLTSTGLVVGTPSFLAPEQVSTGGVVQPETDVYQLGATVYALLAGRPPFEGDTAQVLYSVVFRTPPPLDVLRPDLPQHVAVAVEAAMAREPEERPSSASIFASALAGGSPLSVSPRPAPTVTRPAPPAAAPLVAPARPASQAATLVAPATLADAPAAVSGGRPWPFLLAGGGALFAIALGVLVAREVREGGSGPTPTAPAVVVGPSIMAPASATVVRTVIASATATRTPTTAAPTRTAAAGTATPVRAFTLPTEPARTIPIPAGVDPQVREVVLAINRAGPAYISAVRGPDEGPLREIYTGKALEVYSAFVAQLRAAKQYEADELITISLVELRPDEADRAFARTRERWKLVRVEAGGKRVSAQETVYDEEYVLVRANGRWLIESNPFTVVTTISQ